MKVIWAYLIILLLGISFIETKKQDEAAKLLRRQQTTQRFAQYMEETAPWNIMYKEIQKPLHHIQKNLYQLMGIPFEEPRPSTPSWKESKRLSDRQLLDQILSKNPEKLKKKSTQVSHQQKHSSKKIQKRQVPSDICGNFGRYASAIIPRDVCIGRNCLVKEINCNGTLIGVNSFRSNPSIPQNCFITQMNCDNSEITKGLVILKEQFGDEMCTLERLTCKDRVIIPPETYTGFQLSTCDASIQCEDFRNFGSQFYGFRCTNETLMCSGETIDPSTIDTTNQTFLDSLSNCSINREQCDLDLNLKTQTCTQYDISCNGTTNLDTGCSIIHRSLQCNAGSSTVGCQVSGELSCPSNIFNASDYSGSLGGCLISNLTCDNSNIDFNEPCEISQAICNGIIVDLNSYNGLLSDCEITRVQCPNGAGMGNCTQEQMVCNFGSQCNLILEQFPCQSDDTCLNQNLNDTRCFCPWDYSGPFCEDIRDLTCETTLISPEMNCNHPINNLGNDPKNQLLDRDPACLVFGGGDSPVFQWNFTCSWRDPNEVNNEEVLAQNFTYDIINERFGLSKREEWEIFLKLYNFNRFSDDGMLFNLTLSGSQQLGNSPLSFSIPQLSSIPSQYIHGNRIYLELFFEEPPRNIDKHYDNKFIDSEDFKFTGTNTSRDLTQGEIILIILGVLIGVIIIGLIVKKNWKKWYHWIKGV